MPRIIRVPADASVAAIHSALAGARAHDVALAFPFGVPCLAGTHDAMRDLHARCSALEKDVVILGGDAHLRAVAVAAGFPAATSLVEWVATQPRIPAIASASPPTSDEWDYPRLSLVAFDENWDSEHDPFDPFDEVPPEFVQDLMARDGAYGAPNGDDGRDAELADETDPSAEDSLLAAHERYEEHITRAIRHTGGLSLSRPTHPPLAPFSALSSEPPEHTGGDGSQSL